MLPITKVSTLLEELSETNDYEEVVKRIQLPLSELNEYLFWSEQFYTRNCIERNEKYELIVLCWEPEQYTPIHCHNQQECWIYMVEGELDELQFQLNKQDVPKQTNASKLIANNFYHTNDDIGFHSLSNLSEKRCISLHLYAKPIEECSYFSEESKSFKTKILSYSNSKSIV
ncbi:MAG: cysteine dioxygenase family protein [Flavobacteriaceae bacterium]|nr:cysteine dioxygenase family protein [Flavobacteriaceae bacterium]